MASEKKLRKLEEVSANSDVGESESNVYNVESDEEPELQPEEKPRPLFPPTDVILEVEGRPIHVNKQILADSSPVFKKMFESDFKEKHMSTIPLPDKKYEDFEKFVFLVYNPGAQYQITNDTVTAMLSLAVEYQVTAVQNRCESFLTSKLEQPKNHKMDLNDIPTLLSYAECAEKYDLRSILELAVDLLARYDVTLLKLADVKGRAPGEVWTDILEKRNILLTTCLANVVKNGIADGVIATLNLVSGMECGSSCNSHLMKKIESTLTNVCKDYEKYTLTCEQLVDIIIAGERYELQTLLSSAIELASKCPRRYWDNNRRYNEISDETKLKIANTSLDKKVKNFLPVALYTKMRFDDIQLTKKLYLVRHTFHILIW